MVDEPQLVWLWNGDLEPDLLRRQLLALYATGCRSVVIWGWAGLSVPFLSTEYLDRLNAVCAMARASGVRLWLADDLNWPSGTAAGRLLAEHPEYAQRVLVCTSCWVRQREPSYLAWQGEGEQLVAAVTIDAAGSRRDVTRQLEESARLHIEARTSRYGGHIAPWTADVWDARVRMPAGESFLAIATVVRCHPLFPNTLGAPNSTLETGLLDAVNPAAVAAFVDLTLAQYATVLRPWFGAPVCGIVTVPPPQVAVHQVAAPPGWRVDVFPWMADLPATFKEREGQAFDEELPYLLAAQHRAAPPPLPAIERMAALAKERYTQGYWGTLGAWCRAEGLELRSIEPGQLPVLPETLRADRKCTVRSFILDMASIGAAAYLPQVRERGPTSGTGTGLPGAMDSLGDSLASNPNGASLYAATAFRASLVTPNDGDATPGPDSRQWEDVDVISPRWEWQPHSLSLCPLTIQSGWPRPEPHLPRWPLVATFEADYLPPDLCLLYEAGAVDSLTVNGRTLTLGGAHPPSAGELEFADSGLRIVPLDQDLLSEGVNQVRADLVSAPLGWLMFDERPVLAPVALLGAFALSQAGQHGDVVVRPRSAADLGDWCEAGYRRYSGSVTYRQGFHLPLRSFDVRWRLCVETFDGVATCELNQRPTGRPVAGEGTFPLDGVLRPGINELVITVLSTLSPRLYGDAPAGLKRVTLQVGRRV